MKMRLWPHAAALAVAIGSLSPASAQLPGGFSHQRIFQTADFINPTSNPLNGTNKLGFITTMKTMPDGRVFFGTADLRCYFWDPVVDVKPDKTGVLPVPFMDLIGRKDGELGITGVEPSPDYLSTGHFYVSYINEIPPYTNGVPADRRIIIERMTADLLNKNAIASIPGESVIFDIPDDNLASVIHFSGGLLIGDDGMLYLTTGEDGIASNSQTLNSFRGKVLRMNPDGTAPTDNPFYQEGNTGPRNYIYAIGLRNPYRIFKDSVRDRIYVTDTGQGVWEELNILIAGVNYGWPTLEGPSGQAPNIGKTPPANYQDPFFAYSRTDGSVQGHAIVSGLVYDGANFPSHYTGDVFGTDWGYALIQPGSAGEIFHLDLDEEGNLLSATSFYQYANEQFGGGDITLLPNGEMLFSNAGYVLTEVRRFKYTPPPAPPVVNISADKTVGLSPMGVQFSSSVSSSTTFTRHWDFEDGRTSGASNPFRTFLRGIHTVTFTATDSYNQATSKNIILHVTDHFDNLLLEGQVFNVTTGVPVPAQATISVNDFGYGPLGGSKLVHETDPNGNFNILLEDFEIYGPFVELLVEAPGLTSRSVAIAPEEGDWEGDIHLAQSVITGTVDRYDTSATVPDMDVWLSTVTGGNATPYDVAGGRDTDPPSGHSHGAETNPIGVFYYPIAQGDVGRTFQVAANLELRLPSMNAPPQTAVAVTGTTTIDVTLLESSGGDCDETIAPTAPHDTTFAQVQNIFTTNCIGCHGQVSPYKGLNLVDGFAYGNLVNRFSTEVTNRRLVAQEVDTAAALTESFLFEKINCYNPAFGVIMPLTGRISAEQRELVADWILGGAQHDETAVTAWISDEEVVSPGVVQLRAGAEGPNPPFRYFWEFSDGTLSEEQDPLKVFVAFDAPETIIATVTVRDKDLEEVGSAQVSVDVIPPVPSGGNVPPIAKLQWAENIPIFTPFNFDASESSDSDGFIVGYFWDVNNDGTLDYSSTTPFHTIEFPDDDIFGASVTVVDDKNATNSDDALFFVGMTANRDMWSVF